VCLFVYVVPTAIEASVQTLHGLDNPLVIAVGVSPFNRSATVSATCSWEHIRNAIATNVSVSQLNCGGQISKYTGKLHEENRPFPLK
jgi:hypothetical protein